ncbi:MAG TPA: hypothetical protein VEB66_03520 [Opitutaceae bacterium]|nr:hypothetical protein [Opitutaceae bacterium]
MSVVLERPSAVPVAEAEYHRLLGWPRGHAPGERARELADWARRWYAEHGRPWVHRREATLEITDTGLSIEGTPFTSGQLRAHLAGAGADRVALFAVSAGPECEREARSLWEAGRPDEYFFLEMYGSAVTEHLVAAVNGRLCAEAAAGGRRAVAHYSPGYTGWDVAEQNKLFALVARGWGSEAPPLEVLPSGMLRPKKSLLAVVGLTTREVVPAAPNVPCEACAFSPCQYRRAAYRHDPAASAGSTATAGSGYSVNARALRKWSAERVRFEPRPDGSLDATFRFDGTTCSNLGHPLAFEYRVRLAPAREGRRILAADCAPAEGDTGHRQMCAWLSDADALQNALAHEKPLLGRPLDDVLQWRRAAAPSGCHCAPESRSHKWGLALEAIHFALAAQGPGAAGRGPATDALSP